jgi:hypothetical protein
MCGDTPLRGCFSVNAFSVYFVPWNRSEPELLLEILSIAYDSHQYALYIADTMKISWFGQLFPYTSTCIMTVVGPDGPA